MTWPREESRPRINQDSRRVGLLTLVLGGLVIAGLLVMLVPTEAHAGSDKLYCGTPLSAAFKSAHDYVAEREQQATVPAPSPRRYVDVLPSRSVLVAGAACVSSGRIRTSIGGGLLLLALAGGIGALVASRRAERQRTA
jgi:hypothetical protein